MGRPCPAGLCYSFGNYSIVLINVVLFQSKEVTIFPNKIIVLKINEVAILPAAGRKISGKKVPALDLSMRSSYVIILHLRVFDE